MAKKLNINITTEVEGQLKATSAMIGGTLGISVDENSISHIGEAFSFGDTETLVSSSGSDIRLAAENIVFEGAAVKKQGESTFAVLTSDDVTADVEVDSNKVVTSSGVYSHVQGIADGVQEFVKTYFNMDYASMTLDNTAIGNWDRAAGVAKIKIDKAWLAGLSTSIRQIQYISRNSGGITQQYYLELSQDDFATAIRSMNTCGDGGETTPNVWSFLGFPLDKDKDLWIRGVYPNGNSVALAPQTKNRPSGDNSVVYGTNGNQYLWIPRIVLSSVSAYVGHASDPSIHLLPMQQSAVQKLTEGKIFTDQNTGSVTLSSANGISMQSADAMGRVEVTNNGVVVTAKRVPQWLDAVTPAFYDFRTTKDLTITDTQYNSLEGRVSALESSSPTPGVGFEYVKEVENSHIAIGDRTSQGQGGSVYVYGPLHVYNNDTTTSISGGNFVFADDCSVFINGPAVRMTHGVGFVQNDDTKILEREGDGLYWDHKKISTLNDIVEDDVYGLLIGNNSATNSIYMLGPLHIHYGMNVSGDSTIAFASYTSGDIIMKRQGDDLYWNNSKLNNQAAAYSSIVAGDYGLSLGVGHDANTQSIFMNGPVTIEGRGQQSKVVNGTLLINSDARLKLIGTIQASDTTGNGLTINDKLLGRLQDIKELDDAKWQKLMEFLNQ